jgi:exoribonuclease-2
MSEHNDRQRGGGRSNGFSSISSSSSSQQHVQGSPGGAKPTHGGHGGGFHPNGQRTPVGGPGGFDLAQAALDEMHAAGFRPEFGAGVDQQTAAIEKALGQGPPTAGVEDLRGSGWSSIDNDTSKDLDQIEVAERVAGGIKLRVAIGDVAAAVAQGSPIDQHAQAQTQTIYTAVKNFPMLPLELSTGVTSLNESGDRQAVMMTFTVGPDGEMVEESVSLALVRNRAQLAYSRVGPWLENTASGVVDNDVMSLRSDSAREHAADDSLADAPTLGGDRAAEDGAPGLSAGAPGSLGADWLVEQLKLQDEAAQALHAARVKQGALEFHRSEADPVVVDGRVIAVHEAIQNRAMNLIEDLMVAANGVMARALRKGERSGLQRVVKVPARWDRIVALAAQHGITLPAVPNSVLLNDFLELQRRTDSIHYPDLAVAVIKLMGPGEYMLMRPDDDPTGHFGLAARDYTHSTAPNRRFPDLVTQRVLHAMMRGEPAPYSDAELTAIAAHCNDADKTLRKIERDMQKRVAAVAMASHIGEVFAGVVTGASDKGVYARVIQPPFEGRVIQGEQGLDVGDKVSVKLLHTDPARAFIDFAKVGMRGPARTAGV